MGYVAEDVAAADARDAVAREVSWNEELSQPCAPQEVPEVAAEPRGPRRALTLPFGVLGLAAGWMAADFVRAGAFSFDHSMRPALVAACGLGCAIVGAVIGRCFAFSRTIAALVGSLMLVWAGGTCGAVVGVAARRGVRAFYAMQGVAGALVLVPAFLLVGAAVWTVGRARQRSIVDAADRRAPWLLVGTLVAAGTLAAVPDWMGFWTSEALPALPVSLAIGLTGLAVACVLLALDARALSLVRGLARDAAKMRPRAADARLDALAPSVLDLGVGDEEHEIPAPPRTAYRDADHVVRIVRGDVAAAHRAALAIVGRGGAAVLLGAACLITAMLLPRALLVARSDLRLLAAAHTFALGIGVPACDEYIVEIQLCLARFDSPERDTAAKAVRQTREAWRSAARDGASREALASTCATALHELRANPACR